MFSAASVCLPDCVFACLFVNTITSERLDALYKNIALVRMSRSKVKVTGDKKTKKCGTFSGASVGKSVHVVYLMDMAIIYVQINTFPW